MGIDSVVAATGSGFDAVVISQGLGKITLSDLSSLGLTFDDDLSVTVNVTTDDLISAEGTSMLGIDTASALRDMGIDFITIGGETIDFDEYFS